MDIAKIEVFVDIITMENGNSLILMLYIFHLNHEREIGDAEMISDMRDTKWGKNVTEAIGNEYEKWRLHDFILINAPTGSGKTYFILHTFLPYIMNRGERMLYLVNRKILEEQLLNDIKVVERDLCKQYNSYISLENNITISTYQSIEENIKMNSNHVIESLFNNYAYVVCDECHYFDADSTYNTSTQLSYEVLTHVFAYKTSIYISATMECIEKRIMDTFDSIYADPVNPYTNGNIGMPLHRGVIYKYSVKTNYDYLRFHIFNDMDHLKEIIKNSVQLADNRWLVFVDSINSGQDLEKSLISSENRGEGGNKQIDDNFKSEDVVFIDAKFRKNEEAAKSIAELSEINMIRKKVIITTSVMDNGISFHDVNLRNIVITADTKEEFIQMLGRKRKDQEYVDLYLEKRTSQFFVRRYKSTNDILETLSKFGRNLTPMYTNKDGCLLTVWQSVKYNLFPNIVCQQRLLDTIMKNPNIYRIFNNFCFVFRGCLWVNDISINRLAKLRAHYEKLSEALLEDPDAFLKLQLSWLNITDDKADKIIEDCNLSEFEYHVTRIEEIVIKWLDKDIVGDEAKEAFRKDFYMDAVNLLDNYGTEGDNVKNRIVQLKKSKNAVTTQTFEIVMRIAGLSYEMKKQKGDDKPYIISRK